MSIAINLHQIKLSNLRKLIFGFGRKNKNKSTNDVEKPDAKDEANNNEDALIETESVETEAPTMTNQVSAPGHGRLPHSAYNKYC